jgi:hypothetical protein
MFVWQKENTIYFTFKSNKPVEKADYELTFDLEKGSLELTANEVAETTEPEATTADEGSTTTEPEAVTGDTEIDDPETEEDETAE